MTRLRVGTRGSELALRQTRLVCDALRDVDPSLRIEEVVIRTHGDARPDAAIDADWPMGGFVGAIELALLRGEVDFAVHSFKDLPSAPRRGLMVVATPPREAVHDVLVTRGPREFDAIGPGTRIGTSSPRRAAQLRWFRRGVEVVPIRGNVPSRIARMDELGLDAVMLAAAGVRRLGMCPKHMIELPQDQFVPAPGQGALAVQAREGDAIVDLLSRLDHTPTRRAVTAERAFLAEVGPGCQTAIAALAILNGESIRLMGQLFGAGGQLIQDTVEALEPEAAGVALARALSEKGHSHP